METKIKPVDFSAITEFENKIANFYGAKYAVAVDSCTHGLELCLRYFKVQKFNCPKHTYISVPFLANKLGIVIEWNDEKWIDYYRLTYAIIDAAVLWKKDSYLPGTFMCISFQFQKHLSLGRGGIILCDNEEVALELKKMSYDGRLPNIPWREQDIDTMGYHYYMTPETAKLGLEKLQAAIESEPRQWTTEDWPDLTKMKIFNKHAN
jgi:dTDP-4-amino-4,6-dideoxygalactose transaminase